MHYSSIPAWESPSISDVAGQLKDLPLTVFNSDSHKDHTVGDAEFASIFAMDTDFTRDRTRGLTNEQVREELATAALCAPLPLGVTQEKLPKCN